MTELRFEKWEGTGNDFVLVETEAELPTETIRALCDRHRGIGADGILFVSGAVTGKPRMIVRNADGSRPEMCGNGLRCVAAFLARKSDAGALELTIATDAGDKRCAVRAIRGDGYEVAVDMGHARLGPPLEVAIDGTAHRFTTVDVGNPHAITFAPHEDADLDRIGPVVATTPPGGTNVELCRMRSSPSGGSIEVAVWERGVGRTLACGTGACAVAAAACEEGRMPFGQPIEVLLPGGPLEITVDASRALRMKGPARRVFGGEVTIA
ncbi:diaminopimelate epimerase [Polyangium aurulentum]|uniref:diaminopimelate epimerase n=1 Tax=Polyangium aurulentum TaxID=2567896 RepID=UPI0010ADC49C|nr:diaminopimelate epimerase [Polyangium aurulentum]UQA61482.1 diaminopimelate epimerase [Polyangium aurulentum]